MSTFISLLLLAGTGFQFPFTHHNVCRGYGDWNGTGPDGLEFHTGIDLRCDSTEWASNPYWDSVEPAYVLQSGYSVDSNGTKDWVVFMVTDLDDETGWAFEHMREDSTGMYSEDSIPGEPSFWELVGGCVDTPGIGRHLHMTWMDVYNWDHPVGTTVPQPGYFNPFDSLPVPAGYDLALFDMVTIEKELGFPDSTCGIWFTADNYENPLGFDSLLVFQDGVWGPVDATVKAISAFGGDSDNDSCGVRSISYRIRRRDTYTGDWNLIPDFGFRTLFDMTGYLPDGCAGCPPEFEFVFYDHNYNWHFKNNYIITNSGCNSVSDSCLSNVWTELCNPYLDLLDGAICRGAWFTRLWNPEIPDPPISIEAMENSQAFFPDGEYIFEVMAASQGSEDQMTAFLPTSDINNPGYWNASGVVVDNYAPYVDSVFVYVPEDNYDVLYKGGWSMDSTGGRSFNSVRYGYSFDDVFRIAVLYSEPMVTQASDVVVAFVSGTDTLWKSSDSPGFQFIPIAWDQGLGSQPPAGTGFWQCYAMASPAGFPQGYCGRIALIFSDSGPVDLSDNPLDGNPGTNAVRDAGDGFWTGGSANYELCSDLSHHFGEISHFTRTTDELVTGYVEADYPADANGEFRVTIPAGLSDDQLDGECHWIDGFWMFRQDFEHDIMRCVVARPAGDGNFSFTRIRIPRRYQDVSCELLPGTDTSMMRMQLSTDRYHWFCVENISVSLVPPGGYHHAFNIGTITCVDCNDGIVVNEIVFQGGNSIDERVQVNIPQFLDIQLVSDSLESVLVSYVTAGLDTFYVEYTPPRCDELCVVSSSSSSGAQWCTSDLVDTEPALNVRENPVSSILDVFITDAPSGEMNVFLYDLAGRIMFSSEAEAESGDVVELSISTRGLPAGAYILEARGVDVRLRQTVVILE